jgi:anti-anti-sigma factor
MTATVPARPERPARRARRRDPQPHPRIRVRTTEDVVVLRPLGALDERLADRVRSAIDAATDPVVVDLDDCVLIDPAALGLVVPQRHPGSTAEVCLVSRRVSCRELIDRSGVSDRVAVFCGVDDAVQAQLFARSGYGAGWAP